MSQKFVKIIFWCLFRKSQAAQSDQVLYAEDLNVAYQHENVNMIYKQYSKDLVSFFE